MCGICGVYSYRSLEPPDAQRLAEMARTMIHRGPDDEGYYTDDLVGLGFRRLSIIDVEGGHQPMPNEDRTVWVVFNGEIYNFRELRKELEGKGHLFSTRSDTEVIVHGYEEWGAECLQRLNGIFGVAIWDTRRQKLLLARDPFGVKPLYFFDDGRRLRWSSEVKALLSWPDVPRAVSRDALDLFLTFGSVPSPLTIFEGIRKLAPGHRLIVNRNGWKVERYWHPRPQVDARMDEEDYISGLQDRLVAAVERQMVSDVPVGALLSGGVDSAAVVAIMRQFTDTPVRTFSVGFKDGGHLNELEDARGTARLLGTDHHEIALDSLDFLKWLGTAVWHLEEPISSTAPLSMYLLCRLAREHVTVVLTGQGADEPFCGYYRYFGERYGAMYRAIPRIVREGIVRPLVEAWPRVERTKRAARCLGSKDINERFADVYSILPHELRSRLWRADQLPARHVSLARDVVSYWREGVAHLHPLLQMSYVDARLSLPDNFLIYGDKMSMAASVEARVPFLDLNLMALAETVPAALRIRGWRRKYIYKKVVAKWVPQEIIGRRKRGFEAPTDRWFRGSFAGFIERALLSSDSACALYFNAELLANILRDHVQGRYDYRRQLFNLLVFEFWHRQFITRTSVPS